MIRGLYTSASGMLAQMKRTDLISSNLANVNTTGFKKDATIFQALEEMQLRRLGDAYSIGPKKLDAKPYIGALGTGVDVGQVYTRFDQGSIKNTSNPLDLALEGDGFFVVMTPAGNRYTRDGSFTINCQGYLVTKDGHMVMGQNGPVLVPEDMSITVNQNGEIFSDGERIDQLLLVSFAGEQLVKEGDNLYSSDGQPQEAQPKVIQGALEDSNANAIVEMVNLIEAFRAYEASQKLVVTHDNLLDKAVNEIARK